MRTVKGRGEGSWYVHDAAGDSFSLVVARTKRLAEVCVLAGRETGGESLVLAV